MGFDVERRRDGYHWQVYSSAYGMVMGVAKTLERAMVDMYIGTADLYQHPIPKLVAAFMRVAPKRTVKGWDKPPVADKRRAPTKQLGKAK